MHKHGGDIYSHLNSIDFSANINFCGMPDTVRAAAKKAVDDCENYPDIQCRDLREAISVREQVDVEQIICGNGAADLIFNLVLAERPKRALLTAPAFYEYEQALQTIDCQIDKYYLQERYGFEIQEDFLEQITEETDVVFLCNPNNPTGVLTEPEFLNRILCRCQEMDALLVMDECFNDFLEESERYSMKQHLLNHEHLFILKAFTKMYGMAGLRLGYGLCGNRELLEKINKVRQPWSVSIPAQMAGIAAAKEVEFVRKSKVLIRKEREFLKKELTDMGYTVIGSHANFIFFRGEKDLYDRCLKQGIMIRDCSNYEGLSEGWFRIAVKNHEHNQLLLEVLRR